MMVNADHAATLWKDCLEIILKIWWCFKDEKWLKCDIRIWTFLIQFLSSYLKYGPYRSKLFPKEIAIMISLIHQSDVVINNVCLYQKATLYLRTHRGAPL